MNPRIQEIADTFKEMTKELKAQKLKVENDIANVQFVCCEDYKNMLGKRLDEIRRLRNSFTDIAKNLETFVLDLNILDGELRLLYNVLKN
jgi:NifU-like protein involved in Fe-S cluster formation